MSVFDVCLFTLWKGYMKWKGNFVRSVENMNNNDDINHYMPSLLNPRSVKKQNTNLTLTQNSIVSKCSLSLKRNNSLSVKKTLSKFFPPKRTINLNDTTLPSTQESSFIQERLTLNNQKNNFESQNLDKENNRNSQNNVISTNNRNKTIYENSIGYSAIEDINTVVENAGASPFSFGDIFVTYDKQVERTKTVDSSLISISSNTELDGGSHTTLEESANIDKTITYYDLREEKDLISISFGVNDCDTVNVSTNKSSIKKILISRNDNTTIVDCDMIEPSQISSESETDEIMNDSLTQPKKSAIAVNLEIKRKRQVNDNIESSKVLILNTDDISKLSHVIVQPPNYKLVKSQILNHSKFRKRSVGFSENNGKSKCDNLKQKRIDCYLPKYNALEVHKNNFVDVSVSRTENVVCDEVMSRNLGIVDALKCDHLRKSGVKIRREGSPRTSKASRVGEDLAKRQVRVSSSDGPRAATPRLRNESANSHSARKNNADVTPFSVPSKVKTNKTSVSPRNIPLYKIVAGTHFAVDAFSYGEIPNVKHYFLTHFHSDHYSGLKKGFNKFLFCSKITADLCVTRLGVSPKFIRIINFDETISVDGVEVTAVDANHCPGAIMLVFTLPNGKTLLHTGDFRASPIMESYPVFWNKDINMIYLDTTYCNPRYDFPTQDQSLEMALYLLRQKKLALEKLGKKFTSVLIVCGTYTIGKEKFFLGMARRVGCSVWACPEKDRVLHAVEGRSFSHAAPHACQLHVVPMRDLTHEKLRSYLETLKGTFSEVVAFKPSGWENGKNSAVERDNVTIHGIPYSEHSSFSELIRFVKFLQPKQVIPTVDISGGVKSVQKYFPCPVVCKEDMHAQTKVTDYFSIQTRQHSPAVT